MKETENQMIKMVEYWSYYGVSIFILLSISLLISIAVYLVYLSILPGAYITLKSIQTLVNNYRQEKRTIIPKIEAKREVEEIE
jgi:hypothetical protein